MIGKRDLAGVSAAGILLIAGAMLPSLSTPAWGQAAGMAGIASSDTISVRATVKAVNQKTRMVTLVGPQGDTLTLKVSDEVRNLAQVKPGNRVIVKYHASIAFVLAPAGTKLPDDSMTVAGARAAPGETPGAALAQDCGDGAGRWCGPVAHTLQIINPSGGLIRTVNVVTPEGQQSMRMINVGDTITAVITEAIAVSVEPAADATDAFSRAAIQAAVGSSHRAVTAIPGHGATPFGLPQHCQATEAENDRWFETVSGRQRAGRRGTAGRHHGGRQSARTPRRPRESPTSSSSWATMSAGSTSAPTTGASCPARRRTSTSWPPKACCSPTITPRQAARRAGPTSSPASCRCAPA